MRAAILTRLIVLIVITLFAHPAVCSTPLEGLGGVTSVKSLTAVMYRDMKGWGGAYKLLNATGRIGSQGPDDPLAYWDAPLVHYSKLQDTPTRSVVVLLPVKASADFFGQWLTNPTLQSRVQAVLVDDTEPPSAYSTLGPFPGAEYAPYSQRDYAWNTAAGSHQVALAQSWFPAPVFLLTAEMAADAQQRAKYNSKGDPTQQQYHARFKLTMTASAATNSSSCIAAGICKPVGGYSVWSALPPLPPKAAAQPDVKPIILVVAQMDAMDMFHDAAQGANAPLSGLVALLGAMHALKAAGASSAYTKRVVFLALAGEPWGYMGSRRFLYEAATGSNATAGLDLQLIEKVIDVSQVGLLKPLQSNSGTLALYAHAQQGAAYGNASEIMSALTSAAQEEASAATVTIQQASSSNPGIPPSSLMSFLRVNSSVQGVVLAEYDKAFTNPFYASRFDNGSNIQNSSIASTAAVLAAALHRLVGGSPSQFKVDMTELQGVINEYISCIILPEPGFACARAASMMTADYVYSTADGSRSYAPKNYVGVLQYLPDVQGPLSKSNLARFLWNVMALETHSGSQLGAACDPFDKPCAEGQVCAGWRSSGDDEKYLGKCATATVRYVPSYSTRLACQSCTDPWGATWQLTSQADAWNQQYNWPPDPVWTESDWPNAVPDLQLYLHESPAVENGVLIAGFLVTAAVGAVSYAARLAFARHQLTSQM